VRKRIIATQILIFLTYNIYGQGRTFDGYIVTGGVRYEGEVIYKNEPNIFREIKFLKGGETMSNVFTPSQIEEFGIGQGRKFVTKSINGQNGFMNILIWGDINLYYHLDKDNNKLFFLENDKHGLRQLNESKNDKGYYGILRIFLEEGDLVDTIEETKLTEKSLMDLIITYHKKTGIDYQIIYNNEKLVQNTSFSINVGYTSTETDSPIWKNPSTSNDWYLGLHVLKNISGLRENLFLGTGLSLFSIDINGSYDDIPFDQTRNVYHDFSFKRFIAEIPFYLSFMDKSKEWSPVLSVGVNTQINLASSLQVQVDEYEFVFYDEVVREFVRTFEKDQETDPNIVGLYTSIGIAKKLSNGKSIIISFSYKKHAKNQNRTTSANKLNAYIITSTSVGVSFLL